MHTKQTLTTLALLIEKKKNCYPQLLISFVVYCCHCRFFSDLLCSDCSFLYFQTIVTETTKIQRAIKVHGRKDAVEWRLLAMITSFIHCPHVFWRLRQSTLCFFAIATFSPSFIESLILTRQICNCKYTHCCKHSIYIWYM